MEFELRKCLKVSGIVIKIRSESGPYFSSSLFFDISALRQIARSSVDRRPIRITCDMDQQMIRNMDYDWFTTAPTPFSSIFFRIFRRIKEISSPIFRRLCDVQRNSVGVEVIMV